MKTNRIFISSVQEEFATERAALRDYIRNDPLLRRFFDAFLFEDVPAADRRLDDLYLNEVERSQIYLGLFGKEYGYEDQEGISPTQREFEKATELNKHRLIFIKALENIPRHPKMQALIQQIETQLIRRRFNTTAELISALYASLVKYLDDRELIRSTPFDATACSDATLEDLSAETIAGFVRDAREARGFPLREQATPAEVLTHLNLLDKDRPTHAAILLFAREPQRFLISSEIKCAHFHGCEATKPIPSYQVYKGNAFELVDQAVDFVMSKINLAIGTRETSVQVPVEYEIPREVVAEAIVNAVAHRDYTSNGSVQVMLFADRLEIWNPGTLPPTLTLEMLRGPHGSIPANPLLAEPLYLTKYIERMGTGTRDMISRCSAAGLPEPEFALADGFTVILSRRVATDQPSTVPDRQTETKSGLSRDQVMVMDKCRKASALLELMALSGRSNRTKFRDQVLRPLIEAGLVEMTVPGKPRSSNQKYRITEAGLKALKNDQDGKG